MGKSKLITSAIAAEMLGFTQDYVRRLCVAGKIKAEKLGHDWIFPITAIKHLKRQRKKKETPQHGNSGE